MGFDPIQIDGPPPSRVRTPTEQAILQALGDPGRFVARRYWTSTHQRAWLNRTELMFEPMRDWQVRAVQAALQQMEERNARTVDLQVETPPAGTPVDRIDGRWGDAGGVGGGDLVVRPTQPDPAEPGDRGPTVGGPGVSGRVGVSDPDPSGPGVVGELRLRLDPPDRGTHSVTITVAHRDPNHGGAYSGPHYTACANREPHTHDHPHTDTHPGTRRPGDPDVG